MKGDLARALADQDQAVRLDPQSPLSYLTRGDTYRYKGDFSPMRLPTTTARCGFGRTTFRHSSGAA